MLWEVIALIWAAIYWHINVCWIFICLDFLATGSSKNFKKCWIKTKDQTNKKEEIECTLIISCFPLYFLYVKINWIDVSNNYYPSFITMLIKMSLILNITFDLKIAGTNLFIIHFDRKTSFINYNYLQVM